MKFATVSARLIVVVAVFACSAHGSAILDPSSSSSSRLGDANTGARIADFPWLVAVLQHGRWRCGGTLLSPTWILTAASCVEQIPVADIAIRHNSSNQEHGGSVVPIERIVVHPNYDAQLNNHNIAVLIVADPIAVDSATQIVLPWHEDEPAVGSLVRLVGWGNAVAGGFDPQPFRHQVLRVISNEECRRAVGGEFEARRESMCARSALVCQNDAGSPLVQAGRLVGVSVYSAPCGYRGENRTGQVAAFERVNRYMKWMDTIVG